MNYHLQVLILKALSRDTQKHLSSKALNHEEHTCKYVCSSFHDRQRNRTSDLRIPCSEARPLSHRDSTVSHFIIQRGTWFHQILLIKSESQGHTCFSCKQNGLSIKQKNLTTTFPSTLSNLMLPPTHSPPPTLSLPLPEYRNTWRITTENNKPKTQLKLKSIQAFLTIECKLLQL